MELLVQGEKTVELISEQAEMPLKNASAQLKELRVAGFVKSAKEGKYVTYSIADDDKNLRLLAQSAREGRQNFGVGFDNLRKHYPIRREFHNYEVINADQETADWLKILGFGVKK